jgi:2-oxoglutarate ferredoxin oxidoreductase subunit beta
LVLQKNKHDYDLSNKRQAMNTIETVREEEKILTGLIYANKDLPDTHQKINTVSKPLNSLTKDELCPGSSILDALNAEFR